MVQAPDSRFDPEGPQRQSSLLIGDAAQIVGALAAPRFQVREAIVCDLPRFSLSLILGSVGF
jgi:hypothetical protein